MQYLEIIAVIIQSINKKNFKKSYTLHVNPNKQITRIGSKIIALTPIYNHLKF